MSSLAQQPDVSASTPTPASLRAAFKLGITGWILILGLLALNFGVLFETIAWDKHTLARFVYTIDPRYWPVWPSALLWGIVAWKLNTVLKTRIAWIAKKQSRIKPGVVLITLLYAAWLAGWMGLRFRRMIYQLYLLHIVAPGAQYAIDGTFSWKLLVAPMLGLVVIASLIYVAYTQRKKRHESTIEYEKYRGDAGN